MPHCLNTSPFLCCNFSHEQTYISISAFWGLGSFLIVLTGKERSEIFLCLFQLGYLYFFNGGFAVNNKLRCHCICPGLVA